MGHLLRVAVPTAQERIGTGLKHVCQTTQGLPSQVMQVPLFETGNGIGRESSRRR
jgi:hypothetical protein